MKRNWIMLPVLTLAFASWMLVGCGDNHGHHMAGKTENDAAHTGDQPTSPDNSVPQLLTMSPSNGSTEVPIESRIHLKFNGPMDMGSVMSSFHLADGQEMQEWMDSLEYMHGGMGGMGGHGGMGGQGDMMDMEDMMTWMDSISMHGEFYWNDQMDSCDFIPDSVMHPDYEYMILMDMGDMMSHDGTMMDATDHEYGLGMYHFTTRKPDHL